MKTKSRAQELGVHPKAMASRTKRKLASIRKQMEDMSKPWMDIDNTIDGELETLLHAFDNFSKAIDGSVEFLNEPMES